MIASSSDVARRDRAVLGGADPEAAERVLLDQPVLRHLERARARMDGQSTAEEAAADAGTPSHS